LTWRRHHALRRGGFTIVELVMVIVIIGILSVIAHSRFSSFYDLKLEGAARKLAADIRYAQQVALSQHEAHGIEFDTTNNRYRLYAVSSGTNVTDPLTREAGVSGQSWTSGYVVTYNTDPEFEGIDMTSASFGSASILRFTSLGTPQDSVGANLSATGSVGMSLQGYSRTVQVTPNTGQVAVQ
jgi:MSHA pilin protein MshC